LGDRFGVKITLALKATIETSPGEPGISHNVVDRHGLEPKAVEESPCAPNNFLFRQATVLGRIRHRTSLSRQAGVSILKATCKQQNCFGAFL
jgi:hypothetical protein